MVAAACGARAQVVDVPVPLNYNHHGMAHTIEAQTGATGVNADMILFRSISDRGLVWDPSNTHAFGTNPVVGTTGIGYGLWSALGYANTTAANAASNELDIVHLGNRVWNRGMETSNNVGTTTGQAVAWAPLLNVVGLAGDGTTATATTDAAHGLAVGQVVAIVGATPAGFDGNFAVTATPTPTTFQYACAASGTAGGSMFCNSTSTPIVTALSGNGTTVTATTITAHGFAAGNTVNLSGSSIPDYNGQSNLAAAPTTTSFTYNSAAMGTPTGTQILAGTCVHDGADQATTLASPITVDAGTEIGVVYNISDSGGQFDCVLTFFNGSTNTNVTVRLAGPDWAGAQSDPLVVHRFVSSQKRVTHTVGGTTYTTFQGVSGNDAGTLGAFSTSNASPNLNVVEAIIGVPRIIAAGINVAGQQLTKITFRNAFYSPTAVTALTGDGTTATATVASNSGCIVGQSVTISGTASTGASYNGTFKIASLVGTTQFTFLCPGTGTASAQRQVNGAAMSALTLSGTVGTGTTSAAHGLAVGDTVTITGSSIGASNGAFSVATAPTSTTFTYATSATGTTAAQMQATRPGQGRGYAIYAATVRKGSQDCAHAMPVTTSANVANVASGNLHGSVEPASGFGTADTNAVWFSYTATASVPVVVSTCTTAIDTTIAVYGSCGGAAIVGNNHSATCGTNGSLVTFNATAGSTYLIRVAGNNGATGTFTLHLEDFPPPANNSPATASAANAGIGTAGDTMGTVDHASDGFSTIAAGTDVYGVWYQYVSSVAGSHTMEARTCLDGQDAAVAPLPQVTGVTGVRTVSSASTTVVLPLDTTIAVYTGTPGNLTRIAANDDGCSVSSRVQWTAAQGTQYYIRVASKTPTTSGAGNFYLHVDDPAPTDLTMPLQFNWNGICHGTTTSGPLVSEQTVPSTAAPVIGQIHENRFDLNGYRSIADRSLLFDPNQTTTNALNYGGTVGYQGMAYQMYSTALQSDMVHVGDRTRAGGGRPWATAGTTWPAEGGTSTNLNGLRPLWLNIDDQTTDQVSSMTAMNATFGPSTKIGLLYHLSNVGAQSGTTPYEARFDMTLRFQDGASVVVQVHGTDWFGGASAAPYNQVLPTAASDSGLEVQRILGIYHGTQNTDKGDDATTGPLKVEEAVISTASLLAMAAPFDPTAHGTLQSITFGNVYSGNTTHDNFSSAVGIYAATLRNPASFSLNYPPAGVGTVTPNQLGVGSRGRMTVNVSRGSGSPNNITSVVVDASSIGLGSIALNDGGTNGDISPNDNVWSRYIAFPVDATLGAISLPFTVTDAQSRTASGTIIFTLSPPTGTATPNPIAGGATGLFTVSMAPNTGAATDISSIVLDASPMGAGMVSLNDSHLAGDAVAGDGIWSSNLLIPTNAAGAFSLPFTVTDASARTATGTIAVTVNPGNDACATPTALTVNGGAIPGGITATTTGTAITGACTAAVDDVWYTFPAVAGTSYLVAVTPNTATDTAVGLMALTDLATCPPDNSTTVACTAAGAAGSVTNMAWTAAATQTIKVRAAVGAGAVTNYTIQVTTVSLVACCDNASAACTTALGACPSGSSPFPGGTCTPSPCPASGACCFGTNNQTCSILIQAGCTGTYNGDNSVCTPTNPCFPADECASTTLVVEVGVTATGSNVGATPSVTLAITNTGSCTQASFATGLHRDVFWRFTAPATTSYVIDTCGSTLTDTVLAIHSGCPASQANLLDCNDDSTNSTPCATSTLNARIASVSLTAGQVYFIAVAGYNGGTGTYTLNVNYAGTVGSCCNGSQCVLTDAANCTGTYTDGGVCTPNPCGPSGVCCRGSTCTTTITSAGACTGSLVPGQAAGAAFATAAPTCNTGAISSTPCCYANYNKVNGITVQDIFDFLGDWFAGSVYAKVGGDGAAGPLTVQNIFDFLSNWFAGGCS
jgi:hypothetical protein